MALKLDVKDKKILALLDENARYSNSQIARKVGLSKPAVEYRIRRLQKNNAILEFYTLIDFNKLGYSQYKIYLKLQDATLDDEKKIIDYWTGQKNIVWIAQIRGPYDLTVSVLAENNFEFGRILSNFMNKFSRFILEKDVLMTEYSPIYPREYLTETSPSEFVYGIPTEKYELDEADRKILRALSTNARIPVVELAEKTGLTRDIVNYRLRKLKKDKIIFQFRCFPNFSNIGMMFYKLVLRTKNFNEEYERKIKQYIAQHKKATQLLKLIGSWDLEIEFEVENEDELYKHLTEIRKKFSDVIRDFDIIRITETHKYNFFPF